MVCDIWEFQTKSPSIRDIAILKLNKHFCETWHLTSFDHTRLVAVMLRKVSLKHLVACLWAKLHGAVHVPCSSIHFQFSLELWRRSCQVCQAVVWPWERCPYCSKGHGAADSPGTSRGRLRSSSRCICHTSRRYSNATDACHGPPSCKSSSCEEAQVQQVPAEVSGAEWPLLWLQLRRHLQLGALYAGPFLAPFAWQTYVPWKWALVSLHPWPPWWRQIRQSLPWDTLWTDPQMPGMQVSCLQVPTLPPWAQPISIHPMRWRQLHLPAFQIHLCPILAPPGTASHHHYDPASWQVRETLLPKCCHHHLHQHSETNVTAMGHSTHPPPTFQKSC